MILASNQHQAVQDLDNIVRDCSLRQHVRLLLDFRAKDAHGQIAGLLVLQAFQQL